MIYEEIAKEIAELLRKKQAEYGEYNIERFGTKGILIRLNDKLSRLINLIWDSEKEPNFESTEDTWKDIAGYAILGIMLERKQTIKSPSNSIEICHKVEDFLQTGVDKKTIDTISDWLNSNGFVEASMAIDAEFEL